MVAVENNAQISNMGLMSQISVVLDIVTFLLAESRLMQYLTKSHFYRGVHAVFEMRTRIISQQ